MSLYNFTPDDAERFAREQGIYAKRRGNELHFRKCPYCRNTTDDKNTFAINLDNGQFKCLRASCGAKGNMITLARDFGFSLGSDVDEYYSPKRKYRNIHRAARPITKPAAVSYMESRGISQEITEQYDLTTQSGHDNILVFPFYDENEILRFVKYRKTDFDKEKDKNKEWCEHDCQPILFGMNHCKDYDKPLILTEGQIDSLSVAESGIENAVSVPTGAKGFTWVPYCWDFMSKFKTLIVFGDHEKGHITLLEEMKTRFSGSLKHIREEDYKDCKDANEILRKYGKDAIRDAIQNAVPIENPRIVKVSEVQRIDFSKLPKINTGFKDLNAVLGGFYLGQLILITGERGDGKSTFASQIGTFAMKEGYPVFYYSGELVDWYFKEWLERQIAGALHINSRRMNDGTINHSVDANILPDMAAWYEDLAYLYSNEIIKDGDTEGETLLETMKSAIQQYGCKVLIIDNLMTALDDDISSDQNRQQTIFVKELARMSKSYNVVIFLVAHPKKKDGTKFSNDSVSGSSNITNLCDVVLRYMRPPDDEKKKNDDEQQNVQKPDRWLQVTKNRLNGKLITDDGIKLYYQESSKRISENPEAFDWELGWEHKKIETEDDFEQIPDDESPFGNSEE